MGLNNTHALGRNIRASIQNEASFGTGPAVSGSGPGTTWVAGDSIQLLGGVTVEPSEDRKVRMDARQSRSAVELIQGQRANNVALKTYILCPTDPGNAPSGSNTGIPDAGPLLTAGLGTQAAGSGTVTYGLSAAQTAPPSIVALFEYNGVKSDLVKGWVIEETRISIPNGDEPTFEFTGPAREHVHTGAATATGALTGGATSEVVTVGAGEAYNFEVGSYVSIGNQTNLLVTAVNPGSNQFTVQNGTDPGNDNVGAGTGAAVVPFTPYAEGSGTNGLEPSTLISSINGQLGIGATSDVVFQSAEIVIKNNWEEVRPALNNLLADQNVGFREVTGTVTMWVRDVDVLRALARPRRLATVNPQSLTITLGGANTGDGQCVISIPNANFNFASVEIPESGAATVQVPFTALATDINDEDEISIVFSVT